MILEHIDIRNFRGIARLSLPVTATSMLIGENTWGKSALLDALTRVLSPLDDSPALNNNDFYCDEHQRRANKCSVELLFAEGEQGTWPSQLRPLLTVRREGQYRLRYRWQATVRNGRFFQETGFPDRMGLDPKQLLQAECCLKQRFPVLRLRDARFLHVASPTVTGQPRPPSVTDFNDLVLQQAVAILQQLSADYFRRSDETRLLAAGRRSEELQWQELNQLNHQLAQRSVAQRAPLSAELVRLFSDGWSIGAGSVPVTPLILLENPETRLHPMMLAIVWQFISLLPGQKLVTTNAAELLSLVSLEQICRLDRSQGITRSWQLRAEQLPADDLRRITFHIQVNRPLALFARCWLLVEGEIEVWLINELARLSGLSLISEGIRVVEFAQAGLKPLLRYAALTGIHWHVLTDGDQAGEKYAAIACSQLSQKQSVRHHLTRFPARDIEHFLYRNGFSQVYLQAARAEQAVSGDISQVIRRAIQNSAKPSLAISVAQAMAEQGTGAIPLLLKKMMSRVRGLVQGQYP